MEINTQISWGYVPLIEIFGKANGLVWRFEKISEYDPARDYIKLIYESGSDTELTLTYLAIRHLGIENMLCDYLMKCGVDPQMIPIGQFVMRESPDEMENDWQNYRRKLGFIR